MASSSSTLHHVSHFQHIRASTIPRQSFPQRSHVPAATPPPTRITFPAGTPFSTTSTQLCLRPRAAASRTRPAACSDDDSATWPERPAHGEATPLKIGIVGFGNFGQFIARGLQRRGHEVLATSRSDYSGYCGEQGIRFFRGVEAMCEEQPDVVLVCSSILSTEGVLRGIPTHKLRPDTIFADVLSVKQFPRNLFLEVLPPEFGIVCTHPMFGPESGKHGWDGLPFVYDKVRIAKNSAQAQKCAQFLSIFEEEGCRMVEMSCEEHDRHAAGSQFITHTIGRILSNLNLESTPINTKGYETLLQLKENTISDSFDLYYGLFMYNVNATDQIENLDRAFETVKQKLFGRLHDILRKQIVERVPTPGRPTREAAAEGSGAPFFLPPSGKMRDLSSFAVPLPPPLRPGANKEEEEEEGAVTPPVEAAGLP